MTGIRKRASSHLARSGQRCTQSCSIVFTVRASSVTNTEADRRIASKRSGLRRAGRRQMLSCLIASTHVRASHASIEAIRLPLIRAESTPLIAIKGIGGWVLRQPDRVDVKRLAIGSILCHINFRLGDSNVVAPFPANGPIAHVAALHFVDVDTGVGRRRWGWRWRRRRRRL